MKLLITQIGILAALAIAIFAIVPAHSWPSVSWKGRLLDNVTGFRTLPQESPWIQKLSPQTEQGFSISCYEADASSAFTQI